MIKLVAMVLCGLVAAILAKRRNRSVVGWACLGALLAPAVAILVFLPAVCPQCKQRLSEDAEPRCRRCDAA
jgi:hypothetical protein